MDNHLDESITAKLCEMLEASTLDGEPIPDGKTVARLVAETIIRKAIEGDFRFLVELLNRTEGKCSVWAEEPIEDREVVVRWEEQPGLKLIFGDSTKDRISSPRSNGGHSSYKAG